MPIEYRVDAVHDILVTRVTGVMTDAETTGYMERLIEDPAWRSGMNGFVDARGIEQFDVTSAGIERALQIAAEGEHRFAGSCWAVVTDQEAVFGMTRMFELRRDAQTYTVQVFREPKPAFEWLGFEGPIEES